MYEESAHCVENKHVTGDVSETEVCVVRCDGSPPAFVVDDFVEVERHVFYVGVEFAREALLRLGFGVDAVAEDGGIDADEAVDYGLFGGHIGGLVQNSGFGALRLVEAGTSEIRDASKGCVGGVEEGHGFGKGFGGSKALCKPEKGGHDDFWDELRKGKTLEGCDT